MAKTMVSLMALMAFGASVADARAEQACFEVQGMTCATCSVTVKKAVGKLSGIQDVKVSVEKKSAIVKFDPKQTNAESIEKSIDEVGYKATPKDCKKIEG